MDIAADTYKNPLGHAPIGKLMLRFSIPCIISFVVNSLYNIVDQIFIGHGVGYLGNAATNVVFPIVVMAIAMSLMLGDGGAAFMNLNLGKGDKEKASKVVGNVVVSSVVAGAALSAVCLIFMEPICRLLGATADSMPFSLDYGYIIASSFVFITFSTGMSALIRADGNPGYSMAVMITGAIINIVLDPVFIFGCGWGVKGAALATVIGQAVSAGMCVFYFSKFKHVDFTLADLKIHLKEIAEICMLGISSFITQAAIFVTISANNNALTFYGAQSVYGADIPLAALGITMKVNMMMMGVCIGIAAGCAPIISFNFGAMQLKRVKKTVVACIAASAAVMVFATVCYELLPQYIVLAFGSGSELYERFSIKTFRIFLCLSVLNSFQICSSIFFQAIGKPVKAIVISISRQVVLYIPVMLAMCSLGGIEGILWTGPIVDALTFFLALPLLLVQFMKFKKMDAARH